MIKKLFILALLVAAQSHLFAQKKQPNIIVILADDLGYSDIGAFGSEIKTPNLDKLAKNGLIIKQFYNAGRCCPSRASLLTGLYPHQAGVGDMVQDKGFPAYQGYLNEHCITIGQALKQAGYSTIVSGKWHVGLVPSAWAVNRGFDDSFTLQNNGSSYFNSQPLYNDGRKVTFLKGDKEIIRTDTSTYLTQEITNFAISSLEKQHNQQKPFFLYVAYNAPHWPIQALPKDIAKYKGKYLKGWDKLRASRFKKLKEQGIIDKNWDLSNRFEKVPDWEKLSTEEKDKWDTRMAIYAAMIDRMDAGIGEILQKVKTLGEEDNTLILFLSDNGGSADDVKNWNYVTQKNGTPGSAVSIDSYESPWGNVSNTPFQLFKKNTHEGGIASPFIAYYPKHIKAGTVSNRVSHVIDIFPTCLEYADFQYPDAFQGKNLTPLEGISLKKEFEGQQSDVHEALFWEHEGSKAVRKDQWKAVAENNQPWELYNLTADRTETKNVAKLEPKLLQTLIELHQKWSVKVGVEDWNRIK
ncbi:arylsulfatase [Flavobacterium sp. CF108]|uniref:arylsulfatase n=1 Tax=unclassified Flavobacterium TaxID=196869 RepID=UPI0008C268D2|nr:MULTISPECIES: arylsulfatase [unclassified Flavobacterium]SEN96732.1 arylsulfatase [Flavobacterium sp. fv08]SHH31088.1 arylsulfatase [Flavobacterium sp. CF108]